MGEVSNDLVQIYKQAYTSAPTLRCANADNETTRIKAGLAAVLTALSNRSQESSVQNWEYRNG